jgi:hypothetical protein
MNIRTKPKIVLLGKVTSMPVAGPAWGTMQYLVGLERLGYEAYYVEAHASTPKRLMKSQNDDASALAAAYIDGIMRHFGLGHRWCFHALHADGRCYGMSDSQLHELYRSAALIINFHGATIPQPEHYATGRLIYLETDPVELEIELYDKKQAAVDFLEPHVAFFTWGLNYGNADCRVPLPERFPFRTTPPPVVPDLWQPYANGPGAAFTTIGNWRQKGRVKYQGECYTWSKHHEFLKFLDVPGRTGQEFELALCSYQESDQQLLEAHGWRVRPAVDFSHDLDEYRDYITHSRGEFTVAKDQNVRLRSGWFSERSAQYLAAGRPVITQDTGFSNVLPTGEGLFSFSRLEDITSAVAAINADYPRHSRAASEIAREWFGYERVLKDLLGAMGV